MFQRTASIACGMISRLSVSDKCIVYLQETQLQLVSMYAANLTRDIYSFEFRKYYDVA